MSTERSALTGGQQSVRRAKAGTARADLPRDLPLAIVVVRSGQLPTGAREAVEAAQGNALVVGRGAEGAAGQLGPSATSVWWAETEPGLRAGTLSRALAPRVAGAPLLVLPVSPDGRDLAPRLAAALGRPLLANAGALSFQARAGEANVTPAASCRVLAELVRLDGRLTIPAEVDGPAVATYLPDVTRTTPAATRPANVYRLQPGLNEAPAKPGDPADVVVVDVVDPEPGSMDLADAELIVAGGAGLVPANASVATAQAIFELLAAVAKAMGASPGATRVASDSGWVEHEGTIGTTGTMVRPKLYVALGISGATQHVGGIGSPQHIVSVNTDPSSHMTAVANLGLVTDALGLLVQLANRLGVEVPDEVPHA